MTIQRVELRGERYVILPEHEFLELQRQVAAKPQQEPDAHRTSFREVVPLKVGGIPASQILMQDRR